MSDSSLLKELINKKGNKMKVYCRDCKYFKYPKTLNRNQIFISTSLSPHEVVYKSYDNRIVGKLNFELLTEKQDFTVKLCDNSDDICEGVVEYRDTYLDKIKVYGNPSILNKNNKCKYYKRKFWRF